MAQKQAKRWVFTINNPVGWLEGLGECEWIQYACWALEEAPTTGTPHWQGYLECTTKRDMNAVISLLRIAGYPNVLVARGTQMENRRYCAKSGQLYELGDPDDGQGQGKRSDLRDMFEDIKKGVPVVDLASKYPHNYIRYFRPPVQRTDGQPYILVTNVVYRQHMNSFGTPLTRKPSIDRSTSSYCLEPLAPGKPSTPMTNGPGSGLSPSVETSGSMDITDSPQYSSTTSLEGLADAALPTSSGCWIDTQYKSQRKDHLPGGVPARCVSHQTFILDPGTTILIVTTVGQPSSVVFHASLSSKGQVQLVHCQEPLSDDAIDSLLANASLQDLSSDTEMAQNWTSGSNENSDEDATQHLDV